MNSTWNDGEPIATSTNTAINIKMSASPPTVYETAFMAVSAFSLRGGLVSI